MGDCSKQVVNQKRFLWLWFRTSQVKCTQGLRGANVQTSVPQILIYSFSEPFVQSQDEFPL